MVVPQLQLVGSAARVAKGQELGLCSHWAAHENGSQMITIPKSLGLHEDRGGLLSPQGTGLAPEHLLGLPRA